MKEAIYKQPLVLFLGAGASKPLGLETTPEFWDWFRLNSSFDYKLLNAIAESIEPSQEIGGKPDIEAVLDILEKIIEGKKLEDRISNRPSYTLVDVKWQISEDIKSKVVERYSRVNEEEAFKLYRPLLELAIHQPLPVFTTNYDLALEKAYEFTTSPTYDLGKAPFNLIDGFSRERIVIPAWSRSAYEDYRPTGADVILFKLHGSVDWVRTPSGVIQRVESRKKDPADMKTVIAYPSRLKREIHEEPFRTNYDYLMACLLSAKLCAVIGFSFRDQEIVEEFRQAMGLNERLELMIIDPHAEEIQTHLQNKLGFKVKAKLVFQELTLENAQLIADQIGANIKP